MSDVATTATSFGPGKRVAWALVVGVALMACVDRPAEEPTPPPRKLSVRRPTTPPPSEPPAQVEAEAPPTALLPPPRDLHGKVVLHAGDSMVGGNGGLAKGLSEHFRSEGAKFVRDAEVSVSIRKYSQAPRFRRLLDHFKPDIVILTLGANDVFLPYPEAYGPYVESIVKTVGERECYWVGPPTWKPDTGIVSVIREHAGRCKFFDSSHLDIARAKDRIHPNDAGGAEWAGQFWSFFQGNRRFQRPRRSSPSPTIASFGAVARFASGRAQTSNERPLSRGRRTDATRARRRGPGLP